ncbi:22885_t:CDS:2 [Cetraspora pellucida]|uniref:22885_t:CDS:1 n=1 Tax=Cetraspora pellucida TaxID=1433469 RepID=A0A9N9ENE4_9GLOM|nr:22885_t:CDS:2 [Cetraspora pellucida]
MVRCPKLFKWLTKASDVAISRRKKQGESDFGTLGRNYKKEETIINKEIKTFGTVEDDGLESKEFHQMSKKKYRSLPVPSLRKSQVMDENQKILVDKRRFCMVDPFIPSHNRCHTIDSTRTYTPFCGFDGQPENFSKKDFNMVDDNSKVKLDFINESNEESPATILVAKKAILTRHGQFSVHSARLIRGGSIHGYSHVIKKDDDNRKSATHFGVTQVKLHAKNVLRFSSLITESTTMDYFNEIKPMIIYLNYLDQISIIESPEKPINIQEITKIGQKPGICQCGKQIAYVGYSAHWCQSCESKRFEKTFDPVTKNYILVMQYARNGDLTKYLMSSNSTITWERRLEILYGVATGEWLVEISDGLSTDITKEFQIAEKKRLEIVNQKQYNQKENNQHETININRYIKSDHLKNRTMSFTRTHNPKEHFSVCEYMAAETALYSLKFATIQADNTKVAAEVYDILQYW